MSGYIGSKTSVTQVDGYNRTEADAEFVQDPNSVITVSGSSVGIGTSSPTSSSGFSSFVEISGSSASIALTDTVSATPSSWEMGSTGGNLKVMSDGTERMRIDSSGNVGIGTSSPNHRFHLENYNASLAVISDVNGSSTIFLGDTADNNKGRIIYTQSIDTMKLLTNGSEAMRIDSSGNLLVGKTTLSDTTAGISLESNGRFKAIRTSNSGYFGRLSSDGAIVNFAKDGTAVGSISTHNSRLAIGSDDTYIMFDSGSSPSIWPSSGTAGLDNTIDLGDPSYRFDDIYATNGSIQTSDANEKQDIASLTATEMLVAARISGLFKTFRWIDSVADKGDNARTHTGVIAQDVQAAFTAEGLDAGDYALFTSATWWETQTDVPAVEADEDNEIEAADAYTRTDTYDTLDEAPDGATERTRMGIRYPELLAFVGAYNEQRFASIETRLAALEAV